IHYIKSGPGNAFVGTIGEGRRDRKTLRMECTDHPVFAIDRVRRWKEFAGRLATEHVAARRRFQQIGRVRLAAFELLDSQWSREVLDLRGEIMLKTRRIETQRGGRILCA